MAGAHAPSGVSREATRRAVDRLAEAGVLREITGKRRLRRSEAVGLFAILDAMETGGPGTPDGAGPTSST